MVTKCSILDGKFFYFERLSRKGTNDSNTCEVLLYYRCEFCFCLVNGLENLLNPLEEKDPGDEQERQGCQR